MYVDIGWLCIARPELKYATSAHKHNRISICFYDVSPSGLLDDLVTFRFSLTSVAPSSVYHCRLRQFLFTKHTRR